MNAEWPAPSPAAVAQSQQLVTQVRARLEAAGGWLDFAEYMELALYAPGLGYYSGGTQKFGAGGDFITAPEISPAYGACIARAIAPVLQPGDAILELGAGTGAMAVAVLDTLATLGAPAVEYQVLEVSAQLRERQQRALRGYPVRWLGAVPAEMRGVIIANEVADALPVRRFRWQGNSVQVLGVEWADGRLQWAQRPADGELARAVAALQARAPSDWPGGYTSELCPRLAAWVATLTRSLARGLLLILDYGLPAREYYHPQREDGTLICHYRHRAHTDPFLWPGLQDITAWVNFTVAAEAGIDAGAELIGYATQAHFLMANGLLDAPLPEDPLARATHAGQLRRLLLPGEMGEHFKVLALGRDMAAPDFCMGRDFRHRL